MSKPTSLTVGELIKQLKKFDPETMVVVCGYEGGYKDGLILSTISIVLNVYDKWYYGPHKECDETNKKAVKAIRIA